MRFSNETVKRIQQSPNLICVAFFPQKPVNLYIMDTWL